MTRPPVRAQIWGSLPEPIEFGRTLFKTEVICRVGVNAFKAQVALVVGGGSPLGRITAQSFAGAGAQVMVADKLEIEGARTVRRIREAGGEAVFCPCDPSRTSEVEALLARVTESFGRLDCAVNVIDAEGPNRTIGEMDEADWDSLAQVNLKSSWLCLKHEIEMMLGQPRIEGLRGAIVNLGSIADTSNPAIYTAIKYGVIGLTKAAALDYSGQGIRINAVCPETTFKGAIHRIGLRADSNREARPNRPVARQGTDQEVADAVLFLCSNEAGFIHGHPLHVDYGWSTG